MTDEEKPQRLLPPAPAPEAGPAAMPATPAAPAETPHDSPRPPARPAPAPEIRPRASRGPRPELVEAREPLYRESGGYRLRIDPKDLARLRELPGARGKSDRELGDEFFDGQAARLVASLTGDVPAPEEVRVVVDPYSRQAFLAVGKTIRGIVSF